MKVPSAYPGVKKPRIEMLPLIDIVFLLLVFFIYAMLSMAVHRSMSVTLPTSSETVIDRELNLTVTVRENGIVFLDQKEISIEELSFRLIESSQTIEQGKQLQVDLFADKRVSYQELYRVLDIIRSSGIANVSLQADSSR